MTAWVLVAAAILLTAPANADRRRAFELAGTGRLAAGVAAIGQGWRSPLRRSDADGRERRALVGARLGPAVGAALGGAGGFLLGGPAIAVAGAAVGAVVWAAARRFATARLDARDRADLLRGIRLMISELDAGATPAVSLSAAAGGAGAYGRVFAAAAVTAEHGGDPGALLAAEGGELSGVGQALRIAEQTGAALAVVLDRVAADLGAVIEQSRAAAVALAGPRSSAAVLAGLPVLGIGLGVAMSADPVGFLLGSGPGRLVCAVGVLLDVAGVCWMARIVRRAERA